jgi:mono/diheme cytochrome c family protein
MKWISAVLLAFVLWMGCSTHTFTQGERLYQRHCAPCHMNDGTGLQGIIPPLAGADYVLDNPDHLPCIVVYGMEGPVVVNGITYDHPMAGITGINDVEIANILNFVQSKWGNPNEFYSPERIRKLLSTCE